MGRPAKSQSLFKSTHELKGMVRSLKKLSEKAIQTLELALDSEDEKLRVTAAQQLLKFYMDSSKEVNQDSLNRLILEVKTNGLIGQGSTAQDDNTPQLNFDEIHADFRDNVVDAQNVVDLSDVSKIG